MIKEQRAVLKEWAISYRANPATLSQSYKQALAIKIDILMSDGEWRTSNAIASDLDEKLHSVRAVMGVVAGCWGYESHRKLGYRRLNNVNQHELRQIREHPNGAK
jgi:hypothetical protein